MSAAQTRFNNDQVRARQQQVDSNPAASLAVQSQIQRPKKPRSNVQAVGNQPNQIIDRDVSQIAPPSPPQNFIPKTQAPVQQAPQPVNDPIAGLLDSIKLEKLVTSPEMKNALTKVRLRDYFNRRDSGPDKGRQILEILGTYQK